MKHLLTKRLSLIMSLTFVAGMGYAQSETGDSGPENPTPGVGQEPLLEGQANPMNPLAADLPGPFAVTRQGIPFGGFLLSPELVLQGTYDSNIYALPTGDISDWIASPSVSLVGRSDWRQHKLNFDLGADTNRYSTYSTENTYDYWMDVDGRYDFSPTSNVFGGLRYSRNHEDRGSPNPQLSLYPTVYFSTKAFIGGAFESGPLVVRIGATSEDLNYLSQTQASLPGTLNNNDRDQLQYSFGARVGYSVSPDFVPFVQALTDTRNYKQNTDDFGYQRSSSGYRASVGASFKPATTMTIEAFVGNLYQDYADDRFASLSKPYFGADFAWRPLFGTRFSALLDRTLEETTVVGASSYLDTTLALGAEHALTPDLIADARIAYSVNEYEGTSRQDKVTDARAGFKYYFDPTVFFGVDLRVINRESDQRLANYFRDQLIFSLGYTPGRKRISMDGGSAALASLAETDGSSSWKGFITPKLGYFDNSGNPSYLNQYNLLDSTFGNGTSNGILANLDFSLLYGDGSGGGLFLENEGYGPNNQRFHLESNSRTAKLGAYYSVFNSATGTFGFQYNPDMVVGGTDPRYADPTLNSSGESAHVAYFNNDSAGDRDYEIKRTNYGGSVVLKPAAFGEMASVELGYDGYSRKGNQVSNYVLDNYLLSNSGGGAEPYQWRGYAKAINEQDGKLTYNFSLAPMDDLLINYEFSIDKFQNDVQPVTFANVSQWAGPKLTFSPGVDLNTPLGFVPDSTQYSNGLRVSKNFGDTAAVSAGISYAWLEQNTFSEPQNSFGYSNGRTDTNNAYLTGRFNVSQSVGLEAFARYNRRQNDSSFPVAGFYEPVSTYGDPRMVMPRIDSYKNLSYGLEAKLYPSFLKTTWSAGWKHETKDNGLTWGTVPALAPPLSLYGSQYSANEVFIKLVSRPVRGLIVRVTPSYLWASETQLTTDPNELFKVKSSAIYTKPEWNELAVTGYYNYAHKKNDSLSYSDYNVNPRGFADPQNQEATNVTQSFGVNLSVVPFEDVKLSLGYDWNQNDLSAYYFSTNRLRYDYPMLYPGISNPHPNDPLDFLNLDQYNYKVNTNTITAGLEKQWERYLFKANYSLMWADGYNANGLAGQSLPTVDDKIDYLLHTLSLGMEYEWKKNISVRGVYIYDRYEDNAYEAMTGSRNTIWLGVNYQL